MIIILSILALCIYLIFMTPYPFVCFLRRQIGSGRSKSPNNISEYLEKVSREYAVEFPSKYNNNNYDIATPLNGEIKGVILWIHGGSFIGGSSEGTRNFGPMIASQGYIFLAMNYAYSPEYSFPTQLHQVGEMLNYISNDNRFNNKPIILGGDSAGANIAANYITITSNEKLSKKYNLFSNDNQQIEACLLFCGPFDFTENIKKDDFKKYNTFMKYIGWSYFGKRKWKKYDKHRDASPLININDRFPKTYVCDGKIASFLWQGKRLVEVSEKKGIEVQGRFYEYLPHEFQFDYEKYPEEAIQVFNDVVTFLGGNKDD